MSNGVNVGRLDEPKRAGFPRPQLAGQHHLADSSCSHVELFRHLSHSQVIHGLTITTPLWFFKRLRGQQETAYGRRWQAVGLGGRYHAQR